MNPNEFCQQQNSKIYMDQLQRDKLPWQDFRSINARVIANRLQVHEMEFHELRFFSATLRISKLKSVQGSGC